MPHRLLAWDRFQGEPHSFSNLAGTVYFHFDMESFDFHLDVAPNAEPKDVCTAITQAEWWGLELLDDEECEPEILEGGRVRRYLTPIVPAEVTEAEVLAELMAAAEVIHEAEVVTVTAPLPVVSPQPAKPVPSQVQRFAQRYGAHVRRVQRVAALAGLACAGVLQLDSAPHHDRVYEPPNQLRSVQTRIEDFRNEDPRTNPERAQIAPAEGL